MADALALMPGTLIGGHYIIDALINTGGFGSVYRGIDRSEGDRPCAIKETYDVTPSARRQALTEAAVLFTIRSKHLPQVYDAFEDNGRFYLVMQLIEGQTLLQISRQRGGSCSEQEVLRWLVPIMEVLQELHSRTPAVIHRDIKPGNIILTPDGTAVLVDFGITKLYDPASETQTLIRAVSEGFSPIEQYLSKTGPQSDIYAMGATMYFLLTGVVPPQSLNRSYADTLIAPRQLNPQITPTTERALLQALAVQSDARFASMHDFVRALTEPTFTSFSDQTIATNRVGNGVNAASAVTERAQPFVISRPVSPSPAQPSIPPRNFPRSPVTPAGMVTQAPVYPVLPPHPQRAKRAPAPVPVYRALPNAFNQGCLWGLLQGVLAAVMILTLKNQVYVFVGILEGIFFYIVAGFFTTRKGGGSFRGTWAGFWAGISSTIVFWVVTLLGVLVLVAQRLQVDENLARAQGRPLNLSLAMSRAFRLAMPSFATQASTQQNNNGLLVYLGVGLLVAMLVGWLGGLLGNARFRARYQNGGIQ